MRNASTTSKRLKTGGQASRKLSAKREAALARRLERQRYYEFWAPPDVPHRRHEARRWNDMVSVLTLNGRMCQRKPGQRLHTVPEMFAMMEALERGLRKRDPELHRAVQRLTFEDGARDLGISYEVWRRRALRRGARIDKLYGEMIRSTDRY